MNIEFDNFPSWADSLGEHLNISKSTLRALRTSKFEDIESSMDTLLRLENAPKIIETTLNWICCRNILGYHGTRLIEKDLKSILRLGLLPLQANSRRSRLVRALSSHPHWPTVSKTLKRTIEAYGPGMRGGKRAGQVHLTLSRYALLKGFNHYLQYGSEFDYHVTYKLLGSEGLSYLSNDGQATLITIAVPGELAIEATNPYRIREQEPPNLVRELLAAWSFRLSDPTLSPKHLKLDCGIIFEKRIPAKWIVKVEEVNENELNKNYG